MEKPKLWKYKSGKKKGKLRPSAKKYLSIRLRSYWKRKKEIIREEKGIRIPEKKVRFPKLKLYEYQVKLIYDSPRGVNHDNLVECRMFIVSFKEPEKEFIRLKVLDNLEKIARELEDEFILTIPYTDADIGLVDVIEVEGYFEGDFWFENVDYSHILGSKKK
jgi:hypothetical protein